MKIRILLLLSLLFGTAFAFAQNESEGQHGALFDGSRIFTGGLLFGLNASQVDGDNFGGYRKAGVTAGAAVYINTRKRVGFSLELLYSQKGARGVASANNLTVGSYFEHYKMKLNYIETPVMVHFFYTPKIHIKIGASYNALINSKESYESYYPLFLDEKLYPFNKYYVDGIIGVSYVWNHFILDARFQYGITPVRKSYFTPQVAQTGVDQRSRMFSFRIGYLF